MYHFNIELFFFIFKFFRFFFIVLSDCSYYFCMQHFGLVGAYKVYINETALVISEACFTALGKWLVNHFIYIRFKIADYILPSVVSKFRLRNKKKPIQ